MTPRFLNRFALFKLGPVHAATVRCCLGFLVLLLFLTGCLSRPPLQKEHFSIAPAPPSRAAAPALDDTLGLRNVTVAAQFEGRSLVYRVADSAYETDPYAELLVSPDRMLGGAVRQWLRESGLFRDVAEPNSYVKPTRMAELQVTEFYGDFRQAAAPTAVLTMRFVLFDRSEGNVGAVALAKAYSRRIAVRDRTAAGVVQGLRQALDECLIELGTDLARLKN